LLQAYISLST